MKKLIELLRRLVVALEQANETRERFNEIGKKQLQTSIDAAEQGKQATAEIMEGLDGIRDCQLTQGSALMDLEQRVEKLEGILLDHLAKPRHKYTRKAKVEEAKWADCGAGSHTPGPGCADCRDVGQQ